jgi:hypothetical protein
MMRILRRVEENLAALVVAILSALLAASLAWLFTVVVGARLFRDEWTYGFPLAFGIPFGIFAGLVVFILVFRKVR